MSGEVIAEEIHSQEIHWGLVVLVDPSDPEKQTEQKSIKAFSDIMRRSEMLRCRCGLYLNVFILWPSSRETFPSRALGTSERLAGAETPRFHTLTNQLKRFEPV